MTTICLRLSLYRAAKIIDSVGTGKSTVKVGRPKTSLYLYVQLFDESFLTILGEFFRLVKSDCRDLNFY